MIVDRDKLINSLNEIRKNGHPKGDLTGFNCLDNLYSLKNQYMTFISGRPKQGKSEIALELIVNQAIRYNKRTLIYSPEMGSSADIMALLILKIYGKGIMKNQEVYLDESKYIEAVNFCEYYFKIIDTDDKYFSIDELYEICIEFDKKEKNHINILCTEPFNMLENDLSKVHGALNLYVESFCKKLRLFCSKHKKHSILTIHTKNLTKVIDKATGILYHPMPYADDTMWGDSWERMGFGFLTVWRPAFGLINAEKGIPFKKNELLIRVDKAKPTGVGQEGVCSLFFDKAKSRYYEEIDERMLYAFEHENILHHNGKIGFNTDIKTPSLNDLRNTQFGDIPF